MIASTILFKILSDTCAKSGDGSTLTIGWKTDSDASWATYVLSSFETEPLMFGKEGQWFPMVPNVSNTTEPVDVVVCGTDEGEGPNIEPRRLFCE